MVEAEAVLVSRADGFWWLPQPRPGEVGKAGGTGGLLGRAPSGAILHPNPEIRRPSFSLPLGSWTEDQRPDGRIEYAEAG